MPSGQLLRDIDADTRWIPGTPLRGLWCATLTPLDADGGIDHGRFAAHAHGLLGRASTGVAPFGTTGEGQSFSGDERARGLDALLAAGFRRSGSSPATGARR